MVADNKDQCIIGIDLGGTKLLAGLVDSAGNVVTRSTTMLAGVSRDDLLTLMVRAVEELASDHPVAAVGLGVPCLVDSQTGWLRQSTHLPLRDFDLLAFLRDRLTLPVSIDNDGNCAALAESRLGAARGYQSALFVGVGTGIAGGFVVNGELYRGADGFACEFGHMSIDLDGPPCRGDCPGRGCFETLVSGPALVEAALASHAESELLLARVESGDELTGPVITELARAGDQVARSALQTIGRNLGFGLANLVNIFNPDVVVIGGGVSEAGDLLLDPARRAMHERGLGAVVEGVSVLPAAFGAEAGMIGATLLACDALAGDGCCEPPAVR